MNAESPAIAEWELHQLYQSENGVYLTSEQDASHLSCIRFSAEGTRGRVSKVVAFLDLETGEVTGDAEAVEEAKATVDRLRKKV